MLLESIVGLLLHFHFFIGAINLNALQLQTIHINEQNSRDVLTTKKQVLFGGDSTDDDESF